MQQKHIRNSWYFYVCFFFVFSVIGWLCETAWVLTDWQRFVNRGFLYGPYLPIYGVGSTLTIICFEKTYNKKTYLGKINIKPFLIFVYSFIILSVLEYVSSYLLEMIFDMRWWSYDNNKLNLNGRICLKNSIYFGVSGVLIMYSVYSFAIKLTDHISEKFLKIFAWSVSTVMVIDVIISVMRYSG